MKAKEKKANLAKFHVNLVFTYVEYGLKLLLLSFSLYTVHSTGGIDIQLARKGETGE